MVNFKLTIVNLHKEFPEMDLDKLVKIIECVVEEDFITSPNTSPWFNGIKYNQTLTAK